MTSLSVCVRMSRHCASNRLPIYRKTVDPSRAGRFFVVRRRVKRCSCGVWLVRVAVGAQGLAAADWRCGRGVVRRWGSGVAWLCGVVVARLRCAASLRFGRFADGGEPRRLRNTEKRRDFRGLAAFSSGNAGRGLLRVMLRAACRAAASACNRPRPAPSRGRKVLR